VASTNFVRPEPSDFSTAEQSPGVEQAAFEFLIYAIHLKPYELDGGSDLILATAFADYYIALPILFESLSDTLLQGNSAVAACISKLCGRAFRYPFVR
jgi:hypothetical protein